MALLLMISSAMSLHAQTVEYYHTDALGTPVAVTDASGNAVHRSEYAPYGELLNGPVKDGPGYTGHVSDAATQLVYMQQRYYDPMIPRFLSTDPVAAHEKPITSFNRYVYANNNPYKFTDPDGRESACVSMGTMCGQGGGPTPARDAVASAAVDFVPIVGDIKGIVEAIQDPSAANVTAAVVGLVPVAGDVVGKLIKGADHLADVARIARPADGSSMGTGEALDSASAYLGEGYGQVADGVFRSADGTRQVRMTNSDLAQSGNHSGAPHMNFEEGATTTSPTGRQVFTAEHNSHVYLPEEVKK